MSNPNYNGIATTTIESRTRKLADNVTNNSALMMRMRQKGRVKPFSGGTKILQEIDYLDNTSAGWFSGYDTLTTTPVDPHTAAEYAIKEAYAVVSISGLEMAQNRSKERFIPLLRARVENAERSLGNIMNIGVYSDGTGTSGRQLGGTQLLVATTATSGTVGNINRATATWWRNVSLRSSTDFGAAATSASILDHMGRVYNLVVRGTDKVDLIPCDNTSYQLFVTALTDRQVISDTKMAEAGFTTTKFRGADVVLDGGVGGACPANFMYFLNTDYLFLRPIEGYDFYPFDDRNVIAQEALLKIIGWKGNMTMSAGKMQALLRIN